MSDVEKELLKKEGFTEKISFKDNQAHTVELLKRKSETITVDGEEITGMKYMVKEDGEVKTFFSASPTLWNKLADTKDGDVVTIQMKSIKSPTGGFKSTYEVKNEDRVANSAPKKDWDDDQKQEEPQEDVENKEEDEEEEIDLSDIPF